MRLHAWVLMLLVAGPVVAVADDRNPDDVRYDSPEAAERASTACWSRLFSPSEQELRENKWLAPSCVVVTRVTS